MDQNAGFLGYWATRPASPKWGLLPMATESPCKRFAFSQRALQALPPCARQPTFDDANTPHLTLRVGKRRRVFYWYGRTDRSPARIKLGAFPELSVENARKKGVAIRANVSMRGENVDLGRNVWHIPQTKTGGHSVPPYSGSEYVLPGPRGGYLKNVAKQWKAIIERAGITDLGIRDLRRTQGSWQTMTGARIQVVGKTVGHTRPESTNIYGRLSEGPVRGGKCRLASHDGSHKKIDGGEV